MKQVPYYIVLLSLFVLGAPGAMAANWNADAATRALSNGAPDQALSAARDRLAKQPDDPRARFIEGMALAERNQLGDAVTIFETLSAQYPQRAPVWNNLGVLYARQGRLDKARAALSRAIAATPDYAEAQENLGDVYVALADTAYRRAHQQSDAGSTVDRKRRRLDGLVPSLPETHGASPAVSESADKNASATLSKHASALHTPGPLSAQKVADSNQGSATAPPQVSHQIDQVLTRWAKAWSAQDVSAVLAVYSDDYQPSGDTSLAEWVKHQHARIRTPTSVAVSVSHIRVERENSERAEATFSEHYRTADNERDAKRRMVFVREDGDWRIVKES